MLKAWRRLFGGRSRHTKKHAPTDALLKQDLARAPCLSESASGIEIDTKHDNCGICESERRVDPGIMLPSELFAEILLHLDGHTLLDIAGVSRAWRDAVHLDAVWKVRFLTDFGRSRREIKHAEWEKMWQTRSLLQRRWQHQRCAAVYLDGHTDSVYCVQFDGAKIMTGSRDRTVRIWDLKTYQCLRVLGLPNGSAVIPQTLPPEIAALSPSPLALLRPLWPQPAAAANDSLHHSGSILCLHFDHDLLVTGSSDNSLLMWQALPAHDFLPQRRLRAHTDSVLDVQFDQTKIASCSKDASICVWSRLDGVLMQRIEAHTGPINAIRLQGDELVSASCDGFAKRWTLPALRCKVEYASLHRGLACVELDEACQTVLAGGNDRVVYLFNSISGSLVDKLIGHEKLVRALHLNRDNGWLLSGGYDSSIQMYEPGKVSSVVFRNWSASWVLDVKADHRRAIATSQDGRVVLLDFGHQLPGIQALDTYLSNNL